MQMMHVGGPPRPGMHGMQRPPYHEVSFVIVSAWCKDKEHCFLMLFVMHSALLVTLMPCSHGDECD